MWQTPITDRTLVDVVALKELAKRICRLGWDNVDESDRVAWLAGGKGAVNISDVNRISGNSMYLRDELMNAGYSVWFTDMPSVMLESLPYYTTLNQVMRANIMTLMNGFYITEYVPIEESNRPNVSIINAMEINLRNMKQLYDSMVQEYKYSGTFSAGEEIIL